MPRHSAALHGKTITSISADSSNAEIRFCTNDGKNYSMFHSQDCCESVSIHEITGDLQSLVGSPLVVAREAAGPDCPEGVATEPESYDNSETWTTYWFETETSKVRIVWHGSSNGYYSESVQIDEV